MASKYIGSKPKLQNYFTDLVQAFRKCKERLCKSSKNCVIIMSILELTVVQDFLNLIRQICVCRKIAHTTGETTVTNGIKCGRNILRIYGGLVQNWRGDKKLQGFQNKPPAAWALAGATTFHVDYFQFWYLKQQHLPFQAFSTLPTLQLGYF